MFQLKLKDLREKSGLSQHAFAEQFGVAQSTVGNWESGNREPKLDTIIQLADFFGVTTDYLLDRELVYSASRDSRKKIVRIPVMLQPEQRAGLQPSINCIEFSVNIETQGEFFGLYVLDNIMGPRIEKNDIVIVQRQNDVENGEIAVVRWNHTSIVRILTKQATGVILSANNPRWSPVYLSYTQKRAGEWEIIGKVVELRGKF